MKHFAVALDELEVTLAKKIGDGDICLGIRRAVALAGLRMEQTPQKEPAVVNQPLNRLTIITDQMAALAEELKQAEDRPDRREEIAVQLVRLGKLYLTIVAGADSSLDDR